MAHWILLLGGLCIVVSAALQIQTDAGEEHDEEEEHEPFGFQVKDSGVVDGGESEWEDEW